MSFKKSLLSAMSEHKKKISGPHFIFSAENPKHPHENKLGLTHEQVLHHLKNAGYDAHEMGGHYGAPERSIVVYGVQDEHAKQLHSLASNLGQDSSIHSTGKEHKLVYHHGGSKGKIVTGKGTVWHKEKPKDFFTTLPGGVGHFTHNFEFDKSEKICVPTKEIVEEHKQLVNVLENPSKEKIKEEKEKQTKELEEYKEKLNKSDKTRLVHYSYKEGLKTIDPKFKGTGVDQRTRGRESEHPHSFFYREGTEPEEVVTSRSGHKYTTSLGADHKLYDIGADERGLVRQAVKENQGALNMDLVHSKLKQSGFHGFFNSKHPSLSNVVAMYHALPVEHYEPTKK